MTTFAEKYEGNKWIKVDYFTCDPDGNQSELLNHFKEFENHHFKETEFLIAEVRKLASLLDLAIDFNVPADKTLTVVKRNANEWEVVCGERGDMILNRENNVWEANRYTDFRSEEFLAQTRFTDAFEAIKAARKKARTLAVDLQLYRDMKEEEQYQSSQLASLKTSELLKMLRNNNKWEQRGIDPGFPSSRQLKNELAGREHVMNKKERKAMRQKNAKNSRGKGKGKG